MLKFYDKNSKEYLEKYNKKLLTIEKLQIKLIDKYKKYIINFWNI